MRISTPEESIINIFHEFQGAWVSTNKMEELARLTPSELGTELKKLVQIGYEIDSHPELGYRLKRVPDRLIPDEIKWGLNTKIVGRDIITYEQVTSTMEIARQVVSKGAREGLVIFSEEQTKGRGRSGHSWVCPRSKGILATIILKPSISAEHIFVTTGMAAVAVSETIQNTLSLGAGIKWPNDVLINGSKVGGIVVEVISSNKQRHIFSLGIGINVNQTPEELPELPKIAATSLSIEKKGSINRIDFARSLIQNVDKWYTALSSARYEDILRRWRDLCVTIGQKLAVEEGDRLYHGKMIDISSSGGIILRCDEGEKKTFKGEHISLKT